ncbi:hypothetical protein HG531_010969 [Fusarium graminearum]|nr:hypothetical protein HG531_010969 [Fusarium graminearum]
MFADNAGHVQLLLRGCVGILGASCAASSAAAIATTTTASTSAAATVVAVTTVDTSLSKCLHVLALLLASPFATAGLLTSIFGSLPGFARDVIKERPCLVVGNRDLFTRGCNLRVLGDSKIFGSLQRRSSNGLLHGILFVELGVGLSKVEVRIRHDNLGGVHGTSSTTSTSTNGSASDSVDTHFVDLVGQVVHGIATTVTQLSHSNCDCSPGSTGGILDVGGRNSSGGLASRLSSYAW